MKVTKYKRNNITLNARDHLRNPEKIPPNAKMVIYTNKRIVVDTDMQSANSNKDILASINKQLISLNAKTDAINTRLIKVEKGLAKTRREMKKGFADVNSRIDYIVKANKLKDLPKK